MYDVMVMMLHLWKGGFWKRWALCGWLGCQAAATSARNVCVALRTNSHKGTAFGRTGIPSGISQFFPFCLYSVISSARSCHYFCLPCHSHLRASSSSIVSELPTQMLPTCSSSRTVATLIPYDYPICKPNVSNGSSSELDALEEVDVSKLPHLLDIHRLDHLLVVEKHPG